MKERIRELQDKVYELEGLLELMSSQRGLPGDFGGIVERKAEAILADARGLARDWPPTDGRADLEAMAEAAEFEEAERAGGRFAEEEERKLSNPSTASVSEERNPSASRTSEERKPSAIRFGLNDRMRYAREFFNGNLAEFDTAVGYLSSLGDWSEMEDYVYGELALDPADSSTREFMEMLRHLSNKKQ